MFSRRNLRCLTFPKNTGIRKNGLDHHLHMLHGTCLSPPQTQQSCSTLSRCSTIYCKSIVFIVHPNLDYDCDSPYGIVQVLLKIVNPALMIKAVMALLLNSPPGTKSTFSKSLFDFMRCTKSPHRSHTAVYRDKRHKNI